MHREDYEAQAILLLDCLPALQHQNIFALKGGTAINFFIENLPRLSVDIDLTYLRNEARDTAIKGIEEGLHKIQKIILKMKRRFQVTQIKTKSGVLHKLLVSNQHTKIKIEPNLVMRTAVLPVIEMRLSQAVEDTFASSIKDIPVLAKEELYAGKICAALSRQHPRDFFDVKILLEKEGLTRVLLDVFVIYLACSPRPMHELLHPNPIDISHIYESEFMNMSIKKSSLSELLVTRKKLISKLNNSLTDNHKAFLLSVKEGVPDYALLPFDRLDTLPALKWKVINVNKMDRKKHLIMLNRLKNILNA